MWISLVQWRGSIGLFNRKIICNNKTPRHQYYDNFFIKSEFLEKWFELVHSLPVQVIIGLMTAFSYCFMVVTILPLVLFFYYLIYHMIDNSFVSGISHSILRAFVISNETPNIISCTIKIVISYFRNNLSTGFKNFVFFLTILHTLLVLSGTVETNPGPSEKIRNLSFAVWNLDSIPAREFARIPLIETFQATYNFDIFGVCESLLNKDILNDDIFINGFSPDPFRADKPENIRNGGVCLYFKENLPIKRRVDLELLSETIVAEVKSDKQKIFFVLSYCHPQLSVNEFENYTNTLETIYECIRNENPTLTIITGDFNARSPLFWENDNETKEGRVFNNFLISNNIDELINEPTHVLDNGNQSCIDLICTDQANFFTETGVLPTLDSHSKHNIIHGTLNFHVPCPPPYKRKIWEYKSANGEAICNELKIQTGMIYFSILVFTR